MLAAPLIVVRSAEAVALQGARAAIRAGGDPDLSLLGTLDTVTRTLMTWTLTLPNMLALVVTGVCFQIWWHHSVANLRAAGQPITATPDWATGMRFVPFANLVLPFRMMNELVSAAQDARRDRQASLWWAAWLISNIFSLVATNWVRRMGDDPVLQTTIAEGCPFFQS